MIRDILLRYTRISRKGPKRMELKTNVMRILDKNKINYGQYTYEGGALSGKDVAESIGKPCGAVYKTLVTEGKSQKYYVFVIPVCCELDLKKAAAAAGEKSVHMIPQKELLPLTGYVHGGCSPIGMKKPFPTFLHASAEKQSTILFSAGKIGHQVELSPEDLKKVLRFSYAELTAEEEDTK